MIGRIPVRQGVGHVLPGIAPNAATLIGRVSAQTAPATNANEPGARVQTPTVHSAVMTPEANPVRGAAAGVQISLAGQETAVKTIGGNMTAVQVVGKTTANGRSITRIPVWKPATTSPTFRRHLMNGRCRSRCVPSFAACRRNWLNG